MPQLREPVTTRTRAFLERHGIPLEIVEAQGVKPDGVHLVVTNGLLDHPWADLAVTTARAGDFVRIVLPYPDDATRDEATDARNGDFAETIGPEAAARWNGLLTR